MKKVSLKFPSMYTLWRFKLKIHLLHVIILAGAILTCELSDDDVNTAIESFKAVIIEKISENGR